MRAFFLVLIGFYRYFLSPLWPGQCRFRPTCSDYASEAICEHGALKGIWFAMKRLSRCHPFASEGFDPVPRKER